MRSRWLLVPAVSLAAAGASGQSEETRIRPRMEQALALLAAGAAERAIPLLLAIVDEAPDHGPARLQLGALAVERGEWRVAADHLEAAVAADAVPVQRPGLAWALLADALGQSGRLGQALDATGEALRFAPTYLPALLRRSDLARQLGGEDRLETALQAARQALALAPGRSGPWTALAFAARDAGAPALARCAARRAAELGPEDPRALFRFGGIVAASDPAAALAATEKARAAGLEDDPALWMTLGRLRAFRMEMDASLAAYAEALRLDPTAAGEMASLALDALAASGDPELLGLLRERASSRPEALNTRFALAKADLRAGRAAAALAELRRLATERPDHAAILTVLHAALRRAGDRTAADAVLSRLESVKAADREAWERANAIGRARRAARAAASRGELEEAARRFAALAADPGTAADLTELGQALAALGDNREALVAFRRSLDARPFDPATLAGAAEAARRGGDPETADRHSARAGLVAADCERIAEPGAARGLLSVRPPQRRSPARPGGKAWNPAPDSPDSIPGFGSPQNAIQRAGFAQEHLHDPPFPFSSVRASAARACDPGASGGLHRSGQRAHPGNGHR